MALKKLMIYRHEPKETIIDSLEAKEWDDFLIIKVTSNDPEIVMRMQPMLHQLNQEMNKQIVIVPEDIDIEFYGVEPDDS